MTNKNIDRAYGLVGRISSCQDHAFRRYLCDKLVETLEGIEEDMRSLSASADDVAKRAAEVALKNRQLETHILYENTMKKLECILKEGIGQ